MTNDDRFLDLLREDPPPAFKRGLQQKLAELDHEPTAAHRAFWRPALVAAAAALVVAGLAASPAVRAAAGEFLEVFRVRRFAAVPVDAERLSALQRGDLDLKALLADSVEVLEDPGSPEVVADAEAASAAAGFSLRMPTWLPNKTELADICVRGRASARLTIDAGRVQTLLDTLGVADATPARGRRRCSGHGDDVTGCHGSLCSRLERDPLYPGRSPGGEFALGPGPRIPGRAGPPSSGNGGGRGPTLCPKGGLAQHSPRSRARRRRTLPRRGGPRPTGARRNSQEGRRQGAAPLDPALGRGKSRLRFDRKGRGG